MKASLFYAALILTSSSPWVHGQQSSDHPPGTRATLARAAQASPNNVAALTAYAEFLDRYGDAQARDAYAKLAAALRTSGDTARATAVNRRIALLDLLSGDK